jgi:hypothetical protein
LRIILLKPKPNSRQKRLSEKRKYGNKKNSQNRRYLSESKTEEINVLQKYKND